MKLSAGLISFHTIGLVDHKYYRLTVNSQFNSNGLVCRSQPFAPIHEIEDDIRFLQCDPRLRDHTVVYRFTATPKATGINDQIIYLADTADAVFAITRQPGEIRNQSITRACKPIKQRGFTDVRTAYQGDYGFHGIANRLRWELTNCQLHYVVEDPFLV